MSSRKLNNRESEKGAAMVMVLLFSLLLLVASAGLLLETSFNSQNVTDATAEYQAYNAAETGIQAAINALRGNVTANPLIDSTKPSTHYSNKINFRKAVTPAYSNKTGDTSSDARLSRWMNYNYTPGYTTSPDRVAINPGYDPRTGYAYSVTVTDPDNTGNIVSYKTSGKFLDLNGVLQDEMIIGRGLNLARVVYEPATVNNLDVGSGSANASFGKFKIIPLGFPTILLGADLRFQIYVNMTAPYTGTRIIRGWLRISLSSPTLLQFAFDSKDYDLMGSRISLDSDKVNVVLLGNTEIKGRITPPEPYRLLIRSVGYGPNGARKELEAIVQKNLFNEMSAPATVSMIGISTNFSFNAGGSQNSYSGIDVSADVNLPPVGVTNLNNLIDVQSILCSGCSPGTPSDISEELPQWLQTTTNLNVTMQSLKEVAETSDRYFTSGTPPNNFGDNAKGTGITYVEGDATLSGAGGGILVCTGKLTLKNDFDFKGMIIVTGSQGVVRSGTGNGTLQGNIVIAPYNPNNLSGGFLSPKLNMSAGLGAKVIFNSSSSDNGMSAIGDFVVGIAEK